MNDPRLPAQGGLTAIREFSLFVRRRKLLILAPTILMAGLAWTVASRTPPRYEAKAALTLDPSRVQLVDREVVSGLPLEAATLRSELDVIGSRSLNEEVVVKLGLTSNPAVLQEAGGWLTQWPGVLGPVQHLLGRLFPEIIEQDLSYPMGTVPRLTSAQLTDWLVGNLKATNDGRSLTIVVSFTSQNSELAARIANTIAQTYLDDQVLAEMRATMRASDWVADIREDLEKSEAAVDDFRRKFGLLDVKGATVPAQRLGDLGAQLSAARAERMRVEAKLQTAQRSDPESLPDVLASPIIRSLRKDLALISSEAAEKRDYDRQSVLRKLLSLEINRIVAGLANEVQTARKREAELTQSFQQLESELGDAAHSSVRLIQLQRKADANPPISGARHISRAKPPGSPIYPNTMPFLLAGVIGGLVIGGGLAYLRDGFDRRIRQASKVEMLTGIPVFGLLPKVSRWRGLQPQDYPISDPQSRFCAALSHIHAALEALQSSDRKQVILVTSAQPGDGKTSFCIGLARSFAKSRMRVLVIDADPYRSGVAIAFGAPQAAGLNPIIEQSIRLGDIVQADAKSAAHFVPARPGDKPQFILDSGWFTSLLEEARQAYDVVIIDTPTLMTKADAAFIGRFADTRLLLVRWGRTTWDQMTTAVGFLRRCRVGPEGIVMVGVDKGAVSYGQLASYDAALLDNQLMRPSSGLEAH